MAKELIRQNNGKKYLIAYDEVFSQEELNYIIDYCEYELADQEIPNKANWDSRLTDGISGGIGITPLGHTMDEEFFNLVTSRLTEVLNETFDSENSAIIYYNGNQKCGINFHDDGNYKGAVSIYLNKEWHPNWGGFLTYSVEGHKDGIYTSILPIINRLVYQKGGVEHGVTPTTDNAPDRKSLQVWRF